MTSNLERRLDALETAANPEPEGQVVVIHTWDGEAPEDAKRLSGAEIRRNDLVVLICDFCGEPTNRTPLYQTIVR